MHLPTGYELNSGFRPGRYKAEETVQFKSWKNAQQQSVTDRGASDDPAEEEHYIARMIQAVLRSHVCYREVDAYTKCLVRRKVLTEEQVIQMSVSEVNQSQARAKCGSEVQAYLQCQNKREHQDMIVKAACGVNKCVPLRNDLAMCVERAPLGVEQGPELFESCQGYWRAMVRCGLNHLFEDYFREVTGFGVLNEIHLFDLENDGKKDEFLQEMHKRYGA